MVRLDDEAGRLDRREVAERPRPVGADRVAVPQRGRVPVVPVGDVGLDAAEEGLESADEPRLVDAPHPVPHPAVVGVLRGRRVADRLEHERREDGAGVREHEEDRAEVGLRREEHAPAVLLRRRPGVLVGQDDPPFRVLRAEAGEHPEPPQRPAGVGEALLQDVEERRRVRLQHALGLPPPEGLPRLRVPLVAGRPVQDDPHDVVRVARVQLVAVGGRDDVVGRRQDAREVGGPVLEAREGLDLGQESPPKAREDASRCRETTMVRPIMAVFQFAPREAP